MVVYKGYQIKPHPKHPMSYTVVTDGKGGKIPQVLDTLFTSIGIAKEVIDQYQADKGVKNDKTNQES